jgi:hypothetical protein
VVSTEENLGREDSTIPISRAYMRGPWYLPNFGPIHQKAGKPNRDPAVRGVRRGEGGVGGGWRKGWDGCCIVSYFQLSTNFLF